MSTIKTINGLAIASMKTRNGLAQASIKTINGVDVPAGSSPFGGLVSTTDLVDWWPLSEASGTRVGVHAGLDLTDVNTVTGVAGNNGSSASQFTKANLEQLTRASEAALQSGDITFTMVAWVYPDSVSVAGDEIAGKGNDAGSSFEWFIETYSSGGNRVRFRYGGGDVDNVEAGYTTGAWHMVVCWHDPAANTMNYELDNNGTIRSVSNSGGTTATTDTFRIGAGIVTASRTFNGRIQRVGMWKRVLSSTERTALYNSGNGLDY